jgi:chorismate synthase
MSSNFGKNIKIQIFGQSHSEMIGVVIDGLPADETIDMGKINTFLERRKGGKNAFSTPRTERDIPIVVSGLTDNKTCGAPLTALFVNEDTDSAAYEELRHIPRPSHADYNAFIKYRGANDIRGGGHFSGRLTLPLCFAGAVCLQILERKGVHIGAHIANIARIQDTLYDPVNVNINDLKYEGFPVNDVAAGEAMIEAMLAAADEGDSVGGVIECAVLGLAQGAGEPMFDGIENRIAAAIFAVPAIKGIEFGAGFKAVAMKGSEHNDEYYSENGEIKLRTNHAGGILGGIATGMPIIFRVAVKPTPSIAKEQSSVNIKTSENVCLKISGRHDPCIVPRAVPCVEAAAAVAILDLMV